MNKDQYMALSDSGNYSPTCVKYERSTNRKESRSDSITLTGTGCLVRVQDDALELKQGRTHVPQDEFIHRLYRGTHKIKHIVVLSETGMITLNAAEWCREQHVCLTVMNTLGEIILSSTDYTSNISLRRLQYAAIDKAGRISCELIKKKIGSQLDVLKRHAELSGRTDSLDSISTTLKWFHLPDYPSWLLDIDRLRLIEASAAKAYFNAFVGMPIHWKTADLKYVPPHWKCIEERTSLLAPNGNGRHATNPFHAALNYGYALLESQVLQSIKSYGLDPSCAFLHADRSGRESLVYDLMEPHRATVDHLMLKLFKSLQFERGMVVPMKTGECKMNPQLVRFVVASCRVPQNEIDATTEWLVNVLKNHS